MPKPWKWPSSRRKRYIKKIAREDAESLVQALVKADSHLREFNPERTPANSSQCRDELAVQLAEVIYDKLVEFRKDIASMAVRDSVNADDGMKEA